MNQEAYTFAALLIGLLAGAAAIWWLQRERLASAVAQAKAESQIELVRLGERLSAAQEDVRRLMAAHAEAESSLQQLEQDVGNLRQKLGAAESTVASQLEQQVRLQREKDELAALRDQLTGERQRLSGQIAELNTLLEAERSQSVEKLQLLQNAEAQLTDRFKTLAGEILEDKTKRFTEQNQTNLNQLLEPLKVKITEFQGKVEEVYVQEGKDRSALAEQVKQLVTLNNQLSKDAHNLTSALKGQAKAQGNWGELILERVLEASGLRKGHEYDVQESHTRADGTRAQPDVVVHLPEERHLIVDAKVSLTAYEEHANAESESQREAALKRHLESVRAHIKELSEKNYQQLYGLKSLDFVLMFIPVEPAFMLAISHDSELWQDAWKKNVLLVSPSTLLFVVRTVAHLWRQEQQNRNAQDIASRGAELYDKLVGFVGDLENLGDKLDQAKRSYDGALNKFASGRGNVIRQAEMLKELGVKPTKQLSQKLVELSQDEPLVDKVRLLNEAKT
ncbi:MAG: recombinase RmuC [Gallionellales bacterium GWA2_60_142]|nr:MAG: recombinase RmuC [Gallionellales bacterium GWA2_60_142]HCI14233.1 DNA recombination protein RmuC [Gallionellaceae bacterium]